MNNTKICIVGLGYVGLPLAVAFAEKFQVIGFDVNPLRIQELEDGNDRTLEIDSDLLTSVKSSITYTTDIQETKDCNIYIVTVPTPILKDNRPDLRPIKDATSLISKYIKKNDIDLIGLSGQTIVHNPDKKYTIQLGSGKKIYKKL